jgi:ribose 1,5-bisphosphokinase
MVNLLCAMSIVRDAVCPEATPLGPGTLVLVVGASGVGKDALIAGARAALAQDPRFAFPERAVTRPPNSAESHASLSDAEFTRAVEEGRFALTWAAHGLRYGVPASIDGLIADGRVVVVNASRTIGEAARRRYARVCFVLIECPLDVRTARLAGRGRESAASAEARLMRNVPTFDPAEADVRIDNSGPLAVGVHALTEFLRSLPAKA